MKKVFIVFSIAIASLGFVACGDDDNDSSPDSGNDGGTEQVKEPETIQEALDTEVGRPTTVDKARNLITGTSPEGKKWKGIKSILTQYALNEETGEMEVAGTSDATSERQIDITQRHYNYNETFSNRLGYHAGNCAYTVGIDQTGSNNWDLKDYGTSFTLTYDRPLEGGGATKQQDFVVEELSENKMVLTQKFRTYDETVTWVVQELPAE